MADLAATLFPATMPQGGMGDDAAFALVEGQVRARSAQLGAPDALAHMDPAPASVAARLVGLNALYNQNLLHPDLSPFASLAERTVIDWLAPAFGMRAGHMCAGSTIANLTALWCARESGANRVVASADAHISVPKSAAILGIPIETVPVDAAGRLDQSRLPALAGAALVLTAGTTGRGVIDDLSLPDGAGEPAWLHVDAAWAGPLRLTKHTAKLDGIERADSVCVSAHKWLFQPKDSALVFFADPAAQDAISFGSAYLATPNVGIQGSRSAAGVALLGTLIAWGRDGLASKIETCLAVADALAERLAADPRTELLQWPETGVINWRPASGEPDGADERAERMIAALAHDPAELDHLGHGDAAAAAHGLTASRTAIDGHPWVRQVSANMYADIDAVWQRIDQALKHIAA